MCGIVGTIENINHDVIQRLEVAVESLFERGPDSSGIWYEENVAFGHRRLAIQDLTSAGHQPMVSRDGRYVITYNGEVYNHFEVREKLGDVPWRGHSDTETILEAYQSWGIDCLQYLKGMFAIAIWDKENEELFVARDRMGVKPLYYHYGEDIFIFASRPKALFKLHPGLSRNISKQGVQLYIQSGYFPYDSSYYENVHKLPSAHYMIVGNGEVRVKRYWDCQQILTENSWKRRSEDDLIDELNDILLKSVERRMLSDVSLGGFLSGGIDSSLIVAMMQYLSDKPVTSFTIGFNEKEFDESCYAESVAKYLGTDHHSELLAVDDLISLLPKYFKNFDEPFFDHSAFPTMAVSQVAKKYVTVALSGDGADEIFGGYHYYKIIDKIAPFYIYPKWLRVFASKIFSIAPTHRLKLLSSSLLGEDIYDAFVFCRSIAKDFPDIFVSDNKTMNFSDYSRQKIGCLSPSLSAAEIGMHFDTAFTLCDDYLQKVDLASRAYSLEVRQPFLDKEVVEWGFRLPEKFKIKGGNKVLLRKLAYRYIPQKILDRPKQGFGVPVAEWLRGPLKEFSHDLFQDSELFSRISLRQDICLNLLSLHIERKRDASPLLWGILMLLSFEKNSKDRKYQEMS